MRHLVTMVAKTAFSPHHIPISITLTLVVASREPGAF
jgi:hypothetical protein